VRQDVSFLPFGTLGHYDPVARAADSPKRLVHGRGSVNRGWRMAVILTVRLLRMGTPSPAPSAREWAAVVAVSLVACGAGAVALGPDVGGDVLNYHFYIGYAFLTGRLDQDLAPAGPASYFNPLVDVVHYLGMHYLRPIVLTALLGALQGLNIVLLWRIARATLRTNALWLAPLAAFLGGVGQNGISLLGTMYGDNTVSIPALAGLLAIVGAERPGRARLFLGGAAGGAAVGLKLTMAAPHVGLTLLAGTVAWRERRLSLVSAFALGSLAGWGVTDGWWALQMWSRFENPFFPFLNNLFQSPFGVSGFLRDARWRPSGTIDWLLVPADAALGNYRRLQEVPFRDPRLLLVFLALTGWLIKRLPAIRAGLQAGGTGRGLLAYWLGTYVVWFAAFHYYRYAAVLEFLAPILVLALLEDLWPRRTVEIAPALAIALLVTTAVSPWFRARAWEEFWFNPRLPALAERPGELILLLGPKTSFVVPFFPQDASFIGLYYWNVYGPAMTQALKTRVENHEGPLMMLASWPTEHSEAIGALGLSIDPPCQWARFGRGLRFQVCRLKPLE
jgi:hypothetical protein